MLEERLNKIGILGTPILRKPSGPLARKFLFPPFSVLDAKSGEWQKRKKAWLSLGIQSEMGRDKNLCYRGARSEKDLMGTAMNKAGGWNQHF